MTRLAAVLALLTFLPASADVAQYNNTRKQITARIKPQAVPTSTTAVVSVDALIEQITITNTTAGALTITIADRQASPIALLTAASIEANKTYVLAFPAGYLAVNGWTVVASGSGLNYSAVWGQ